MTTKLNAATRLLAASLPKAAQQLADFFTHEFPASKRDSRHNYDVYLATTKGATFGLALFVPNRATSRWDYCIDLAVNLKGTSYRWGDQVYRIQSLHPKLHAAVDAIADQFEVRTPPSSISAATVAQLQAKLAHAKEVIPKLEAKYGTKIADALHDWFS